MAQEKSWVKTGLGFLDKHIGWLRSGTVTRVSWYSNIGKSRFMYRVIVNVLKQWKSVHLFSLEVPKWVVLINLVWAYFNMSTSSVEYWHQNAKLKDFYSDFKDQLLIEDDKTSLEQIHASVLANNKDSVFIDYVQNITATGKDEYERMTKIAQDIQKMAISTWKPFFDLSQVSNEWTKYKAGDMIPSKGSWAFVHACDIGLVLSKWEDKWRLSLILAKNKFWEKDITYTLDANMANCEFKFLSDNAI
jgi:replicative DNA helicase